MRKKSYLTKGLSVLMIMALMMTALPAAVLAAPKSSGDMSLETEVQDDSEETDDVETDDAEIDDADTDDTEEPVPTVTPVPTPTPPEDPLTPEQKESLEYSENLISDAEAEYGKLSDADRAKEEEASADLDRLTEEGQNGAASIPVGNAPADFSSKNWMKYLPNTVSLGAVNLPGTHDSGCASFFKLPELIGALVGTLLENMAQTQKLAIDEQMDAGIRIFDIRYSRGGSALASAANDLIINHGGITCTDHSIFKFLRLDAVYDYAKKFLANNPSETIIFRMKAETSEAKGYLDVTSDSFKKLEQEFYDKVAAEGGLVIEQGDAMPTVGEARGKVILIKKSLLEMVDDEYHISGEEKWDGRSGYLGLKAEFDGAEPLDYTKTFPDLQGTLETSPRFIGTNCYCNDPWPCPAVQGGKVVKKLQAYKFSKGKYYGWVLMDWVNESMAKNIYLANYFDFDDNGAPCTYISDIGYAFEQRWEDAANVLENQGYTVLPDNFNAEGADKPFSDAVVNGRKNNGSFNIAIGYKETKDPMKAVTGLKWFYRKVSKSGSADETAAIREYNRATDDMIAQGHYYMIPSVTKLESVSGGKMPESSEDMASLNIGTGGYTVCLCYSKDYAVGNPLTTLESLPIYRKTDPNGKSTKSRSSEDDLEDYIEDEFASPRDVDGNMFACNYGRNQVDDVLLFYKSTFPVHVPVAETDNKEQILPITATMGGASGFIATISSAIVLAVILILLIARRRSGKKEGGDGEMTA